MKTTINICHIVLLAVIISMGACTQTDEFGDSIFDTKNESLDPTSYTYRFDVYLQNKFLKPYNLQFAYKMKDVSADMDYNLVPASLDNSKKLAVLVNYLWYDAYKKIAGEAFLKKHGPRMIVLIGSSGINPANGTEILGLAEGGIKISLLKVNQIDITDINLLNEFYFKTMHHEFVHILHQTISYPASFNLISFKNYSPFGWQDRSDPIAWSLGFASPYGSSQTREDFVEIIANYIIRTDAQWSTMLSYAARDWEYNNQTGELTESTNSDGVNGRETILRKLNIGRTWFKDAWNVDLDALRAEVQKRQASIDMPSLLLEIENQ